MGAALVRALGELQGLEGKRLVVLASDSGDPQPERHLPRLRELAGDLEPEELRVLLVMVGRGPSTGLSTLAGALGGLAEVTRVENTGQAWTELLEGELLAQRAERREGRFTARLTPEGRARSTGLPARVSAFAPVRAREGALTLVEALDPETEDPPLAVLGRWRGARVLALALRPSETAELLPPLIPLLLPPPSAKVSLQAERRQGGLELLLEGAKLPETARVEVLADEGESLEVSLEQETPRRRSAWLPQVPSRRLRVTAWGPERLATTTVPDLAQAELAELGPDYALLAALCSAAGGRLLSGPPSLADPLPTPAPHGGAPAPLLPWLGLLALLLLVLEAGVEGWQVRAKVQKLAAGHA